MNGKTTKTTDEHFKLFTDYCKEFIQLFGLYDWYIGFNHTEQNEGNRAECGFSTDDSHNAWINLAQEWHYDEITPARLREVAFHEVCHVLLADSHNVASSDDLSREQTCFATTRAHHAVIYRLMKALLGR